jgi:hypothetical protein
LTLSGLLKFDDENWTGWDMIDNQMNFSHVLVRCSFDDGLGNVRTMQGYVMIETTTLGYSPGNLVKDDFALQGNGKLDIFDGLIPCPTVIVSIVVDGQEAEDGIVHIAYSYTGDAYQIKYRLDDTGDYIYAAADLILDIPDLPLGDHSIEIIPVCLNNFEGTGFKQAFEVTHALVCNTTISDITINATNKTAVPVYTGTATQMRYKIDGGAAAIVPITQIISLSGLSVGLHLITIIPLCSVDGQLIAGTGLSKSFTIASQPAQSVISYALNVVSPGSMSIYVNGILRVNLTASGSGSVIAPTGSSVKTVVNGSIAGSNPELTIIDTTIGTTITSQTSVAPTVAQYILTPNGDSYSINAAILP